MDEMMMMMEAEMFEDGLTLNEGDYVDFEEYMANMPCDDYGPAACSISCPKYFECMGK